MAKRMLEDPALIVSTLGIGTSREFDSSASTMTSASAMPQVGQTPTGPCGCRVRLHTHAACRHTINHQVVHHRSTSPSKYQGNINVTLSRRRLDRSSTGDRLAVHVDR